MNQLKIFENTEFGQIRTVTIDNEPWLVGKDVATALGYERTADAIRQHVDSEDKGVGEIQTPGGKQTMTIINESGLYALIFGSKLESAQRFKHWVTSEVLPAIRKTGSYAIPQGKELLAMAVLEAQKTIEQQTAQIEEMKPKAIFADAVATSKQSILIGELAKLLKQNGYDTGEKRLFTYLRDNGYLIRRKGTDYNAPTQRSMEMRLFEVKETAITHSDGHTTVNKTTKVTGKGQQYFINKFLNEKVG
ncbi:phage antirepressor [Blautia sp. JLR.GB0024]|uniref:phage antirepressor n=1 Tax=Blautia sp. JLR.GB0024 TaxID=3123295 RepID=UPI0030066997